LSCGQHNCEEPCHPGSCGTCWRGVIYTEVTCRCGFSVLQPPQPCGSGPPECPRPCDRPHPCDHPVRHTCHNEPVCPPCTILLTKECPGGHGVQFSMPCFQPVLSCGRTCGHPLPGCSHTCQRTCHSGNCETVPLVCTQPCQKPRPDCGHPCALPCHEVKGQTCLQASATICPCGRRKDTEMSLLACDSACTKAAEAASSENANGRFADTSSWTRGLDLNPGQSLPDDAGKDEKLPFEKPEYSKWLKSFALNNFAFAVSVERQLYSLVLQVSSCTADSDSVRTVSYHFPPMKDKRRRFVHELAEFYGIESHSMDPEPGRHVMVLARRGSTKFPGGATDHRGSLTAMLQKEFPGTVKLAEGVRVPPKTEAKKHPAPSSVTRSSYAQVLSDPTDPT
uniref:R3H domain-containing protein n=1 Tax=Echinostoma caproni TaxID=27848 RepID=A0A182ZZH6_9TREM